MRRAPAAAALLAAGALAPAAHAGLPPVTAETSLSPLVHGFGDPVTATVSLSVSAAAVDPASVRVVAHFDPYGSRLLRVDRLQTGEGRVLVRYVYRLSCTTAACLPGRGERSRTPPPARITWRSGGTLRAGEIGWGPLTVASRLTPLDLTAPAFTARVEPPRPRYALSPGVLGVVLLAGGSVLAAAGVGTAALLVGWLLLERRRRPRPVSALQRTLELVEQASRGDVLERRRALYQLALVLEEAGLEPESWAARKLAWAPATPDPWGMQMLSLVIRHQLEEAV